MSSTKGRNGLVFLTLLLPLSLFFGRSLHRFGRIPSIEWSKQARRTSIACAVAEIGEHAAHPVKASILALFGIFCCDHGLV
jgi:hypothetical protein